MQARLLLRLLLTLAIPATLAGTPRASAATGLQQRELSPGIPAESLISAPRQSIPAPVHDESTCAFCQAAAFAPHAASPACGLPEATGSERLEIVSFDDRLIHSGSVRPPNSRAPPALRDS
jgi:hypothetical protein